MGRPVRRVPGLGLGRRGGAPRPRAHAAGAGDPPGGADRPGVGRGVARSAPAACPSSTGCSAAGWCRARRSCSPASPASARARCCSRWPPRPRGYQRRTLYVTGEESASQVRLRADRTGGVHDELYLAAETDLGAVLTHIEQVRPDAAGRRLDPDHRRRRRRRRARRRHPGQGGRRRADPGRQDPQHHHRARRPRHQGRLDRRAAGARAPRRRGAALRGRPQLPVPDGAGDEEPLRPGRRGRLLRPRPPTASPRSPTRPACSSSTTTARSPAPASRSPWRAAGRCSPRCRRWSPRRRRATPAYDVRARRAPGSRWCSPCSSSTAGIRLHGHDVFASTVGGARLTEPASDLAVAVALASATLGSAAARRAWWRWARSAWPASCAGCATCRSGSPRPPGSASRCAVVPGRARRARRARGASADGRRDAGRRRARHRLRAAGARTSTVGRSTPLAVVDERLRLPRPRGSGLLD